MELIKDNVSGGRDLSVAVLIDAENVSASYVKPILEEVARYGNPTIKRIYADWTSSVVGGWKSALLENAISPVQQYSYTQGKNSSDSAMIIDAMDLLYSKQIDIFCIVSSDSDFTRLATRLREAGKKVIGIGEAKTPRPFIQTCDKFIFIDVISGAKKSGGRSKDAPQHKTQRKNAEQGKEQSKPQQKEAAKETAKESPKEQSGDAKREPAKEKPAAQKNGAKNQKKRDAEPEQKKTEEKEAPAKTAEQSAHDRRVPDEVCEFLVSSVTDIADEDGWAFLGEIGNLLMKKDPSFDSRNYGFQKLTPMLDSTGLFVIDQRPTGNPGIKHIYVKVKQQ